jgi:hypothetical protein
VLILLTAGILPLSSAHGGNICKVRVDCPQVWHNDTIYVPDSVVMLSEVFAHCTPDSIEEGIEWDKYDTTLGHFDTVCQEELTVIPHDTTVGYFDTLCRIDTVITPHDTSYEHVDTVSVFFIIDHSGSMSIMDSNSTRYTVVEQIIDSLYARSPASEVGMAVFSNKLLHNYAQDSFFEQLYSSWHDSYIPLTRLDTQVGGVDAVDKLKWAIDLSPTDRDIGGNQQLLNADYSSTGRHDSRLPSQPETGYNGTTDISFAFEAAKDAFQSASNPPDRQYIIFLSDGVAQNVDVERMDSISNWVGGQGVPTTFTAFFINQREPIPDSILAMTENIRTNGYSSSNAYSAVWKTQGTVASLFDSLLSIVSRTTIGGYRFDTTITDTCRLVWVEVDSQGVPDTTIIDSCFVVWVQDGDTSWIGNVRPALGHYTSTPVRMVINGETSIAFDDSLVYFDPQIPLAPFRSPTTTLYISFTWRWDAPLDFEETRNYTVTVHVSPNPPVSLEDQGLTKECWPQGTVELVHEGVAEPVIDPGWTSLDARFYPPSEYPVEDPVLVVMNSSGTDSLVLTTADYTVYYAAPFQWEFGSVQDDDKLQLDAVDSIVVIYRNGDIPLDTVRIAVPVTPARSLAVQRAAYIDSDADGYPDIIRVIQSGDVLTQAEALLVLNYIDVQTQRQITIDTILVTSRGFDLILTEPDPDDVAPFTGLYPSERLYIDEVGLLAGGSFPLTDVALTDSMAPVIVTADLMDYADPSRRDTLVVVFSEAMSPVGSSQPFDLARADGSVQYAFNVAHVHTESTTVIFSVAGTTGDVAPTATDSIWIDNTANVADPKNNRQTNPDNVRRELDYHLIYTVKSATYLDTDGDGLIDIVRVVTDSTPDQATLNALYSTIQLPSYRNFSYTRNDLVATAGGFDIQVTQPANTTPFTGVDDRDRFIVGLTEASSGGMVEPTDIPINDNLAPVIVEAVFHPAFVDKEGAAPPDTLVVTFSEVVSPPGSGSTPFVFCCDSAGNEYTMVVSPVSDQDAQTITFIVTEKRGKDFPETGDSVWVDTAAGLTDLENNVQNKENRHSPLEVKPYQHKYSVNVSPNPLNVSNPEISAELRNLLGITATSGMVIEARPMGTIPSHVAVEASLTVLDVVGNVLVEEESGDYDATRQSVIFVWDCRNKQGRAVGSGTYLALIKIDEGDGQSQVIRTKIGVTRR